MRIVHHLERFRLSDGGVVRAVIDLCNALADAGHRITVLTFDDADAPKDWNGRDGRPALIHLTRARLPLRLSRASAGSAKAAIQGADLLHLHVPWDPACVHLASIARAAGRPYVLSIHGMLDEWTIRLKGFKKRLYLALGGKGMLERAAFVHCTAQSEMDQSQRWYPRGRSVVIPLLVDLSPFDPLPGAEMARQRFDSLRIGAPVILFVGRLHPIKRLDLLIRAAAKLKAMAVPFRLVLAGPGEPDHEKELRRLAAELGLERDVDFPGFVGGIEKVSLYQVASVFVLPSFHENFGVVSIEAMACGTPVVATPGVNIHAELKGSGGAAICEPTAEAMAEALAGILRDPQRRAEMGRRARHWVFADLHPDRIRAAFEAMYRKAVQIHADGRRGRIESAESD
jgi:glycosyltransferase involved in cell wall biosynthesis